MRGVLPIRPSVPGEGGTLDDESQEGTTISGSISRPDFSVPGVVALEIRSELVRQGESVPDRGERQGDSRVAVKFTVEGADRFRIAVGCGGIYHRPMPQNV